MIGDVWEWTGLRFLRLPRLPQPSPTPSTARSSSARDYRVLRGGSWAADPAAVRTTFRNWDYPIRRQIFAGFRCARSISPEHVSSLEQKKMCRHVAWLGPPRTLSSLIHEPEYGLLRQSYAPRLQRHGTVNADGFGMGWYDAARAEPVRYRRAIPIWADANLPALAQVARSNCLLAAVRSATVGMPIEETATAPFS